MNNDDYIYIYENHLGGYYTSDEELDWEQLHCDQCGDDDWPAYEGTVESIMESLQKKVDYFNKYTRIKLENVTNLDDLDYDLQDAIYDYSNIAELLGVEDPYKRLFPNEDEEDM